jgi:hypothetical protein
VLDKSLAITPETYEKFRRGLYDIDDLKNMLNKVMDKNLEPYYLRRILLELFSTRESLTRLLKLSINYSRETYDVVRKYSRVLENIGTPLYKALIISALKEKMYGKTYLSPSIILSSLTEPHHLVSLYNPLVMIYLLIINVGLLKNSVLMPAIEKTNIYEANPNYLRVYIYRDLLLFAALLAYPEEIPNILYRDCENDWLVELIMGEKLGISNNTRNNIAGSYLRIVRGVSENIRALVRGLNRITEFEELVEKISSINTIYSVLKAYNEFYKLNITTGLDDLLKILSALLGTGMKCVNESIILFYKKILSDEEFLSNNTYLLLSLLLELSLFTKTMEDEHIDVKSISKDALMEGIELFGKLLSNILSRNIDLVAKIINQNSEPYITLRNRLVENIKHRYLVWLGNIL